MSADREPRMLHCLGLFEKGAHVTVQDLQAATGWSPAISSRTLTNGKQLGYVEAVHKASDGSNTYAITGKGRQALTKLQGNAAQYSPSNDLATDALKLINNAPAGLTSEEIGEKLDEHADDVEAALALHVARHALVHCAVKNPRGSFVHYRTSAGTANSVAWIPPGGTQFNNNPVPEKKPTKLQVTGSDAPAESCGAEVLAPAAKPDWSKGVPFVGTLDIDAIHRKPGILPRHATLTPADLEEQLDAAAEPAAMRTPLEASIDVQAAVLSHLNSFAGHWLHIATIAMNTRLSEEQVVGALLSLAEQGHARVNGPNQPIFEAISTLPVDASRDQDEGFLCCLYSDGTLWMQDGGQQFSLNVAETRKLLHYLDHLRADLIVDEALAAAGVAP